MNQKYKNLITNLDSLTEMIKYIYDESLILYDKFKEQIIMYQNIYDDYVEKYKNFIIDGLIIDFKTFVKDLYFFNLLTTDYLKNGFKSNIVFIYSLYLLANDINQR